MRKITGVVLAVALAGCTRVEKGGGDPDPRPQPGKLAVAVAITSAVIADDCRRAELGGVGEADEAKRSAESMEAESQMRVCQQSQLSFKLKAGPGDTAARVDLISVKMFDAKGPFLQELLPRNPQLWSAASSTFGPWDRSISPGQELSVSFDLTAPDWDKIGGGNRMNTQGMGFRVTAVVRIDGQDHSVDVTVESPFIAPDPMIET